METMYEFVCTSQILRHATLVELCGPAWRES